MKTCIKCNISKILINFTKRNDGKGSYRNTCKECTNIYMKNRYKRKDVRAKEKVKSRKWYLENKEYIIEKTKKYKMKSRKNLEVRLRDNLRNRLNQAIKKNQKAGSAVKDLGCSVEELKKHLEVQFQDGMTWNNWSRTGWHIDHIKSLASFDLTKEEEFKKACHYSNLQPLWAKDNWNKRH